MAFSYWESNEWLEDVDLVVVGGGIVGLSAAFRAREMHPDWRILVVEADPFGGGGSSRNAGFTCFGSATELMQDRKTLGDDAALELVRQRWSGLQRLRATFGDLALGHQACGSIELFPSFGQTTAPSPSELADLNSWIAPALGVPDAFANVSTQNFAQLSEAAGATAVVSRLEGMLDTGKMNRAFRAQAHTLGIDVLHGMRVHALRGESDGVSLTVGVGPDRQTEITARRVIVATNAFGRELLGKCDVQPAINHVLVTEPMNDFDFPHTVHMDAGYLYARPVGNRMLIGGGRHWGDDDTTTVKRLKDTLHTLWPATKNAGISHQWTGVLGVGENRSPIVQEVQPQVVAAVRLGGMGVAIGMEIGRLAAEKFPTN